MTGNHQRTVWLLLLLVLGRLSLHAQTVRVGEQDLDGLLRNYQLMGKLSEKVSFNVRPLYFLAAREGKERLVRDSFYGSLSEDGALVPRTGRLIGKKGEWVLLPAMWKFKFNGHHPYGWNDEGMIAAKGLQQQVSAGVFAQYGPVSIQLQPQLVIAANPDFAYTAGYGASGVGSFTKIYGGQSSLRVNAGAVSLGVSTENVWMGPGQYSALLLSNNAPGFAHLTFNTRRPIETVVGGFEFQLMAGRIDEDSAASGLYENFHLKPVRLTQDARYLNAMVFSYRPSFIPGLFLGMTRAFQIYESNLNQPGMGFINKYIPVLSAIFKNGAGGAAEDQRGRDQQLSLFARMLFPKSRAEFYLEYGWNDHKANSRDFFSDPEHAAAYIVGGKKLFQLARKNTWLELNAELTHMSQAPDYVVRNAGNWYIHSTVLQGMTHQRQILGAGSGQGNNIQTLAVNWLRGVKKVGIIIQRIQHDPKALVGSFSDMGLRSFAWNEWGIGGQGRWNLGKWLLNAEIQYAGSDNYGWEKDRKAGNLFMTGAVAYSF